MSENLHSQGFQARRDLWARWFVLNESIIRGAVFVARCSGAATLAYAAGTWAGLPHPLWAAIAGLIVSQNRLDETRASVAGLIIGTLLGIGVAVAVSAAAEPLDAPLTGQIAAGVALCAVVARCHAALRVCMWTCPIVLLTAEPSVPTALAAAYRGSEVILGALVGVALHWLADRGITALAPGASLKGDCSAAGERSAAHQTPGTTR